MAKKYPSRCFDCCGQETVMPAVVTETVRKKHNGRLHEFVVSDMPVVKCTNCQSVYYTIESDEKIQEALTVHLLCGVCPMLSKHEIKLLVGFLDDYSNRLGNSSCNDYELDDTPENRELILNAVKYCRAPDEVEIPKPHKGKFVVYDWEIVAYLKHKLKEM